MNKKFGLYPGKTNKQKMDQLKADLNIETDKHFYLFLLDFIYKNRFEDERIKLILDEYQ